MYFNKFPKGNYDLKGDGKDVDHADGNPQNNADSNLRVMDRSKNRGRNNNWGGKSYTYIDSITHNNGEKTCLDQKQLISP